MAEERKEPKCASITWPDAFVRQAKGQILLFVTKNSVCPRLLSPREATRLMGLPDRYQLPSNYKHIVWQETASQSPP